MIRLWLFLHLLGFTMWLGGGLAAMVAGIAAKREGREGLGAVVRAQAAAHKAIIAPGALLTVLSGLILTFSVSARMGELVGFSVWLLVMQGAGLLGALLDAAHRASDRDQAGAAGPDGSRRRVFRRAAPAPEDRRLGLGDARTARARGRGPRALPDLSRRLPGRPDPGRPCFPMLRWSAGPSPSHS